jgi:glycosyltransferase involved in cell wall biosynthesis
VHICFIEDTHLHGGTQIWVSEATRAILARREAVTLLAPQDSWMAAQCENTGARIVTYDWDEVVNEDEINQETWTQALRECDVAVCTVHPPRYGFHCAVFAAKCIQQGALKTHLIPKTGTIVPEYKREFYLPDESIRSSVIAIAGFTRQYLIDTYKIPAEMVALIYQGTDVRRFTSSEETREEAFRRYQLPEEGAPILGSVGSFEHRKGQPLLFEALAKLASGPLPNIHLMLVGDGPDEGKLKAMVQKMGLERHVSFYPFTDQPNLVFERIDITVLSSLYKEGLPNVLLESMSMGVPVVSTNLGGVPEVVIDGETGYMVQVENSNQLAEAIGKLWTDQNAFEVMGQNARKLMVENFDKEIQFDRFLDYFRTFQ